jgi:hypothetical protein
MIPSLTSGWPNRADCARDAHVAGHGELAAAAEGQSVDGGDGHDARALEAAQQPVCGLQQLAAAGLVHRGEGLDVGAGREEQRVSRTARTSARTPEASTFSHTARRSTMTCGAIEFINPLASHAMATSPRVSSVTVSPGCSPSGCA